jgi:hypothetical protein
MRPDWWALFDVRLLVAPPPFRNAENVEIR